MKRPFSLILIFIVVLVIPTHVYAQNENGTSSFFSAFGLGLLKQSYSPMAEGMGLNGVALDNTRSVNTSNPALLSDYSFTTGYGAIQQTIYTATKDGGTSSYSNFQFDGVGLVFPIMKRKLGVSLTFNPITNMNYLGEQVSTLPGDTLLTSAVFSGNGGLSEFKFGVGYALTKYISIGYAPAYVFGSIKQMKSTLFEDLTYRSTSTGTNDHYTGISHEFGLNVFLPKLFRNNDKVSIGFALRLPTEINVSRYAENLINNNSLELPISSYLKDSNVTLPFSLKAGLTYGLTQKLLFGSDILIENWDTFNSLDESSLTEYGSRLRIGAGIAYLPELRSSSGFLASMSYRMGVSFDSGYFSLNQHRISRFSMNAGLTMLSSFVPSSLDFNMEYGILGLGQTSFVQEQFLSFKFIVNLSEFMFFRRQLQ